MWPVLKNGETEAQKVHSSYLPRAMGSHGHGWHGAGEPPRSAPVGALPTLSLLEAKAPVTSSSSVRRSVVRIRVFFSILRAKGVAQGEDAGVSLVPFLRVTASGQGLSFRVADQGGRGSLPWSTGTRP